MSQQPTPPTYRVVSPPPVIRVLYDGAILAAPEQRLWARAIDGAVSAVLFVAVVLPFYPEQVARLIHGDMTGDLRPMIMVGASASVLYEVVMLRWKRATLGKIVLKTEVRRLGEPRLTLMDILRRQLLPAAIVAMQVSLSGALLLDILDPIWLLFDPCRQTLHDKLAGTAVVGRGAYAPGARPQGG